MSWIIDKIIFIYSVIKILFLNGLIAAYKSLKKVKNLSLTQSNYFVDTIKYFHFKMKKIPSNNEIRSEKTMFLFNHRSHGDFFVHPLIMGLNASFLSRYFYFYLRKQVAHIFNIFAFLVKKMLWFFDRSKQIDVQKFNQWLDYQFSQTKRPGLVVYPQGHRMYGTKTVQRQKLKRGMIKYAYLRKIPVQIMMSFGNENVINEKKLKMGFGEEIFYKIGKVIDPKDYNQANEFVDTVLDEFVRFFNQTCKEIQENIPCKQTTKELLQVLQKKC